MKLIAAAVIFLSGTFAMAYGETIINWPSINGLQINNACATEETLKSLTPVKACTAYTEIRYAVSNQGEVGFVKRRLAAGESLRSGEWLEVERVCKTYGSSHIEVSRYVTKTECAYYPPTGEVMEPCTEFVTTKVKTGLKYSVERLINYGEVTDQSWFKFTIPLCK